MVLLYSNHDYVTNISVRLPQRHWAANEPDPTIQNYKIVPKSTLQHCVFQVNSLPSIISSYTTVSVYVCCVCGAH